MKKRFVIIISVLMTAVFVMFTLGGCGSSGGAEEKTADELSGPTITCSNGSFVGTAEDGVQAYKGIPYAKPPTGDLRWKAPEAPDDSDETFDATDFGKTSIQYEWHSEEASYNEIGEDCLTLNVWTADTEKADKPILFFIHGGGYAWGGTADPLYDGKFIVQEHSDVVVVTCNYRVGLMGFVDFSKIEGGEAFPDAPYLGVLDLIQGLKWVQQNAENFGGDPNNVTIYGESAGGGLVSNLLVAEGAEGLFQHAIAQSGSMNLTYSQEEFDNAVDEGISLAQAFADKVGAKNMDDLMALPEKELIEAYISYDEDGFCVNDCFNMPLRGGNSIIPEDPYAALESGVAKNVDLIVGTNTDEWRYWVDEMGDQSLLDYSGKELEKATKENMKAYKAYIAQEKYDGVMVAATDEEKAQVEEFKKLYADEEEVWQNTEIGNETGFRIPSIETAYRHALGGGDTYMYLFGKKSTNFDWIGACHASELAYVFHNLEDGIFSGEVDEGLADEMCSMWVNFAKTGDPSTENSEWTKYNAETRDTMQINDDCTTEMVSDPLQKQRELMGFSYKYYLK